jgi:hypothetical protein
MVNNYLSGKMPDTNSIDSTIHLTIGDTLDNNIKIESNNTDREKKEYSKVEKVTNSLIRISRNDKLKNLCEERFGKDYFAKLLSNPDDNFINSLNSFINELEKYDYLGENSIEFQKGTIDTEASNKKSNRSYYTLTNNSEILKKKNSSQFRPAGNFSKRVFNKYTCPYGQFFDPSLQRGGKSIYSDRENHCNTTETSNQTLSPKGKKKARNKSTDRIDYEFDKKVYTYKEIPWTSAQDFFFNENQTMVRSPDKVTSNL